MTIQDVEIKLDQHYANIGCCLTRCANVQDKMKVAQQLYNAIFARDPNSQDLTWVKDLYMNYEKMVQNNSLSSLGSGTIGIGGGFPSAVIGGGNVNVVQQGQYGSALNTSVVNNIADTNENRFSLSSLTPATQEVKQEVGQPVPAMKTKTVMAKGYEIKPLLFKEFELKAVPFGLTEAFEIKIKEGFNMMDITSKPKITVLEDNAFVADEEKQLMLTMIMESEKDTESNGSTIVATKEHNFILQKNKPKTLIVDALTAAGFKLGNVIDMVNNTAEPLKTQLSVLVTEIFLPYILVAFRKNQIPMGLENLVSDYKALTDFLTAKVNDGAAGLVIDYANAVSAGEDHLRNICARTLEVYATLADDKNEDVSVFTLCVGNLKTQTLCEAVKYLYLQPEVTDGITKNNVFMEALGKGVVQIPLRIDPHGSFKIYDELAAVPKNINTVIMFDGINKYRAIRIVNEFYIYKI